MKRFLVITVLVPALLAACQSNSKSKKTEDPAVAKTEKIDTTKQKPADAKAILAKREVPVLCYHQIRNNLASDSKRAHDDIIAPDKFREHMKMLADSGYHTILQINCIITWFLMLNFQTNQSSFLSTIRMKINLQSEMLR